MSEKKYIETFIPDVKVLEQKHQGYLGGFDAGKKFKNFNDFLSEDAFEYCKDGNGVTYLVFNLLEEIELAAYYTLAVTSIPYIDRIRLDEEEAKKTRKEFDEQICGIAALEIKMFAVSRKYQDVFYSYDGEEKPISAWILQNIIDKCNTMIHQVAGFKAIFLHSVPTAEEFYKKNQFKNIEANMMPLHCIDNDLTPMYLPLKPIHMNYDK